MKLLLYCTKAKPYLAKMEYSKLNVDNGEITWYHQYGTTSLKEEIQLFGKSEILNGKIVAECDFEVEKIVYDWYPCNIVPKWDHYYTYYRTNKIEPKEFYEKSCLNWEQLNGYLNDYDSQSFEGGYAIHIKNLHIFDKPYELGNALIYNFNTQYIVEKVPQNMMKVYNRAGECHILISIKPEWLCKILNGEKTIEVRKKVLKEMLE